jgi:sec-independent protein translocase protein TatA
MFGLGAQELLLILVIVIVLFGAKRIPEIARGLGKSMTEFKKGVKDVDSEVQDAANAANADESNSKDTNAS